MMKLHLKEHCKLLPDLISPVLAKDHHFFVPIGGSQLQTVIHGYHQLLLPATFTFTY